MSEAPKSMNAQFHDALMDLSVAECLLKCSCEESLIARNNEAQARNKVDEEQGKFDALVAQVKKTAPKDTRWKSAGSVPPWGSN